MLSYVRDTFFELVRIDSPSLHERDLAARAARKLVQCGFHVEEDQAGEQSGGNSGNLIATRQGNPDKPPLLLTAHMDSVPPCTGIVPQLDADGWVRSDGSTVLGADDKAGMTAIFAALEQLQGRTDSLPTLQVVFTVAEELGLQGAKHVDTKRLVAVRGLALDTGGSPGTLVVRGPSQAKWQATVTGRRAHAGVAPERGISAIRVAAQAVARMPHGRVDAGTTVNVGSFVGEGPTNVVTDSATLVGEARSYEDERLDAVMREIEEAFQSVTKDQGASLSFSHQVSYRGFRFAEQDPVRQAVERAIQIVNLVPDPIERGGGSDANIFTSLGIPTVNLGVGYEDIHSTQEKIRLEDIAKVAEIIVAWCTHG